MDDESEGEDEREERERESEIRRTVSRMKVSRLVSI